MQKCLPITTDTKMRAYTYDAYLDAIISNKFRTGKIVASIEIDNYEKKAWKYNSDKLIFRRENRGIIFESSSKYLVDMNGILYRDLEKDDEVALTILYQQYSQPWGNIGIFIADDNQLEKKEFKYQFGFFNKVGWYLKDIEGNYFEYGTDRKITTKIVLRKKNSELYFKFVEDKETVWKNYFINNDVMSGSLKIGVNIFLYDNVYFDWLYSNHIQLKYNKNPREVLFEYETSCMRLWNYYTINYFLVYKVEKMKNIRQMNVSLLDYIKVNIRNENYIELWMECYDLIGTVRYHNDRFVHQCVIYGYSDEKQILHVLCINQGKPFFSQITYGDFVKQSNKYDDEALIVSQEYNPEMIPINISVHKCIESLSAYLNGKRLMDWELLLPTEEYYYGITIYDVIKKGRGLEAFLDDKRMCRLICEHKQFMIERLEYLIERQMIEKRTVVKYLDVSKQLYEDALTLQGLVIKYMLSKKDKLLPKIVRYIEKMKSIEETMYPELIKTLETYV